MLTVLEGQNGGGEGGEAPPSAGKKMSHPVRGPLSTHSGRHGAFQISPIWRQSWGHCEFKRKLKRPFQSQVSLVEKKKNKQENPKITLYVSIQSIRRAADLLKLKPENPKTPTWTTRHFLSGVRKENDKTAVFRGREEANSCTEQLYHFFPKRIAHPALFDAKLFQGASFWSTGYIPQHGGALIHSWEFKAHKEQQLLNLTACKSCIR